MKQQNTLQPKLRFPEFSGDWESDKFKSYVKLNQGLQIPISERFTEYVPNSYFYITNEFLNKNSGKSYYIVNPSNSVICKESDILMTRTGNTGKVVTNVKGAFHNNFFKISYNSNVYKDFLYFYLIHPKIQHIILSRAGTSTIPDLNHSDFYSINFVHPSLTEQQKIADYLTTIDKKISLLEEKKTELLRYNKAMMQKLFAQEIRCKDENGNDFPEWEDLTICDIVSNIGGTALEKYVDIKLNYKFISIGIYSKDGRYIDNNARIELNDKTKTKLLNKNDLVMVLNDKTSSGDIIGSTILIDDDNYIYNQRSERLIPKDFINSRFLWHKLNSKDFRKKVFTNAQGGTQIYVNFPIVKKLSVKIPSLPEQEKIADFLSAMDESIEKVNEQIIQTQSFKKAMLQQMFV